MNDDEAPPEAPADDPANESGDDDRLRARLTALRTEHSDLDAAVAALEGQARPDQIQIARLKKRKLALRDEMVRLEDLLTPDIIA